MKKKTFPIVKNFKIFGIISILLCAVGLFSIIALPFGLNLFNLSIDFAGGTQMEFNMRTPVTAELKEQVKTVFTDATEVTPSSVVDASETHVIVRMSSIDSAKRQAAIAAMEKEFNLTEDDLYQNEDVSASVGQDMQRTAVLSSVAAVVLMMLYISFRFEFTSGLAAVVCLVHDLLVMLSCYVIFQISMDSKFIAAALTILGYSINASIIVFDRVRENLRTSRKEPFEDVAERSVWQTMGRTINTTLTTLFTIGMLCILVPSLRNFAVPLIIGILSGAYSSILLSSTLWGKFRKIFRKKHA